MGEQNENAKIPNNVAATIISHQQFPDIFLIDCTTTEKNPQEDTSENPPIAHGAGTFSLENANHTTYYENRNSSKSSLLKTQESE